MQRRARVTLADGGSVEIRWHHLKTDVMNICFNNPCLLVRGYLGLKYDLLPYDPHDCSPIHSDFPLEGCALFSR
jgi:hypothetical protein